jgi:hypothetical protein
VVPPVQPQNRCDSTGSGEESERRHGTGAPGCRSLPPPHTAATVARRSNRRLNHPGWRSVQFLPIIGLPQAETIYGTHGFEPTIDRDPKGARGQSFFTLRGAQFGGTLSATSCPFLTRD